jgi:hypothetical protein
MKAFKEQLLAGIESDFKLSKNTISSTDLQYYTALRTPLL